MPTDGQQVSETAKCKWCGKRGFRTHSGQLVHSSNGDYEKCGHQFEPAEPVAVPPAPPDKSAIHSLKTWPEYFQAVEDGRKRFELRVNDRDFQAGDWLWLQEWNPETRAYSGRESWMRVTYIAQGVFGLPDNVCVMSIERALGGKRA